MNTVLVKVWYSEESSNQLPGIQITSAFYFQDYYLPPSSLPYTFYVSFYSGTYVTYPGFQIIAYLNSTVTPSPPPQSTTKTTLPTTTTRLSSTTKTALPTTTARLSSTTPLTSRATTRVTTATSTTSATSGNVIQSKMSKGINYEIIFPLSKISGNKNKVSLKRDFLQKSIPTRELKKGKIF